MKMVKKIVSVTLVTGGIFTALTVFNTVLDMIFSNKDWLSSLKDNAFINVIVFGVVLALMGFGQLYAWSIDAK